MARQMRSLDRIKMTSDVISTPMKLMMYRDRGNELLSMYNMNKAKQRYDALRSIRDDFLQQAIIASRLTIPYLIKDDDDTNP